MIQSAADLTTHVRNKIMAKAPKKIRKRKMSTMDRVEYAQTGRKPKRKTKGKKK
jgi:hypothetical protein